MRSFSSPQPPTVRPFARADLTATVAMLARAFDDDPVMRWVFPDDGMRRRRLPGFFAATLRGSSLRYDGTEVAVRGGQVKISRIEVDTSHFKGNFPESCSLEVCTAPRGLVDPGALSALPWKEILTRTKLQADSVHVYEKELLDAGEATHVRFHIYPDGGVARLRIFGSLTKRIS
jgi:hypothetical protein